jgi:hypothetical protein
VFARYWTNFKHVVRVATVLAIATVVTLIAYSARSDHVGLIAGSVVGLFFGYVFVYVNWVSFRE